VIIVEQSEFSLTCVDHDTTVSSSGPSFLTFIDAVISELLASN
jgi:hypothetical protein